MSNFINKLSTIAILVASIAAFQLSLIPKFVFASTFNPNNVLNDATIYNLPVKLNSINQIQKFLEEQGSVLADKKFPINLSLETVCRDGENCRQADRYAHIDNFPGVKENLIARNNLQPFWDQQLSAAEIIWRLTQTSFGSTCSADHLSEVCLDAQANPINPAFLLALIQKESGLVSGACAQKNADQNPSCRQSIEFRMDRATGYICFETSDRSRSCYDQNPFWNSFKGFFRQVYHGLRSLRLREKTCQLGDKYSFKNHRGDHKVGNKLQFSNQDILLETAITCALYIYTPHVSAQKLYFDIFANWGFLVNSENLTVQNPPVKRVSEQIPRDYKPSKLTSFEKGRPL